MREITNYAAAVAAGAQPPVVRKATRVSPDVALAHGDADSFRRQLAEMNPSGTISVELPFQVPFELGTFSLNCFASNILCFAWQDLWLVDLFWSKLLLFCRHIRFWRWVFGKPKMCLYLCRRMQKYFIYVLMCTVKD